MKSNDFPHVGINASEVQIAIAAMTIIDIEAAEAKRALEQFIHDSRPNLKAIGVIGRHTLPAHHTDQLAALLGAYERLQRCQRAADSARRLLQSYAQEAA